MQGVERTQIVTTESTVGTRKVNSSVLCNKFIGAVGKKMLVKKPRVSMAAPTWWLGAASTDASDSVLVRTRARPARPRATDAPDLGPPTAKWEYLAGDGALLACVYRYEPEPCAKEFRPWNVRTGRFEGLDPRPLYNQPALANAETVILVEGEKCAQALIDLGICATTAMHGARAPVDKTDCRRWPAKTC